MLLSVIRQADKTVFTLEILEDREEAAASTPLWTWIGRALGFAGTIAVLAMIDVFFLNQAIWREIVLAEPEVTRGLRRLLSMFW